MFDRLLKLPRGTKRAIVTGADMGCAALAFVCALYLRLDTLPPFGVDLLAVTVFCALLVVPVFDGAGLYRTLFRHFGVGLLSSLTGAAFLYAVPVFAIVTVLTVPNVPRSLGVLQPVLFLVLVVGNRAVAAMLLERGTLRPPARRAVLIYGAGSAGRQLASALAAGREMKVAAFLDDDRTLQGRTLDAVPIHAPARLRSLIEADGITDIILAIPSAGQRRRSEIIRRLQSTNVHVRTLPGLNDLAAGRVTLSDLRELDIEDLLGRPPVEPNAILLGRNITGKTVLVTGAGGSIGSELCRQIVALRPAVLLLVESSEFALYQIHNELLAKVEPNVITIVPLLASVRVERRVDEIIAAWRPHTIYHAAAYKHVPLVEHNVVEGVLNNVWGTLRTALAARRHGVADFVLISTDKAVRPTNVMGTSKRLAEMVLQGWAAEGGPTRFSMVRFGNVLGSSGSVVPLFREQIARGGPVTITHRDITRYFMTIPEAAQLVIQAGAMAGGGEVFVLDMGDPVRIVDLARNMIELSGFSVRDAANPDGDIEIVEVGLRPGEKLYEELLIGDNPEPTRHPRIMKANEHQVPWPVLSAQLDTLYRMLDAGDADSVRRFLPEIVPEFRPESGLVDWVAMERGAA